MGQLYVTSSLGGYFAVPSLSKELRTQSQPLSRFRQFVEIIDKDLSGAKKGQTFNWDIVSNVASAGGTLVETSTIPRTNYVVTQGTGTITEYGNSIPYTEKLATLSQLNVSDATRKALKNDQTKVLDAAAEAQFDACNVRYVGSSATVGVITTNGTATVTGTSRLNDYHTKNIVDYMQGTLFTPAYEGESYMCICTVDGYRGMYDSVEAILKYTKYPANGEFGMFYNTRFIKESNAMDNTMGSGAAYGEAYFFGADAVAEAVATPEEVRFQPDSNDFGRSPAIAWYYLGGFKIIHDGNPNEVIVKYDSA